MPIEQLHVGDTVLAEDPKTGKVEEERVAATIVYPVSELARVALSDGSAVTVTADHPFYVDAGAVRKAAGWVQAGDLRAGDRLRTEGGADLTVVALRYHTGSAHVYTLTVATDHTFFVGAGVPVLVHNCDGNAPLLRAAPDRAGSQIDFVVGPDGVAAPVAEISLQYKSFMPRNEFIKKATALQELGEQWQLVKASNPVARDRSVTKGYRRDLIRRIWAQYHDSNPDFANSLIDRIRNPDRMQPDHIWELQLGGPDTATNLRFLDSDTNRDIGFRQIWPQIRDLQVGTRVRVRIEE